MIVQLVYCKNGLDMRGWAMWACAYQTFLMMNLFKKKHMNKNTL